MQRTTEEPALATIPTLYKPPGVPVVDAGPWKSGVKVVSQEVESARNKRTVANGIEFPGTRRRTIIRKPVASSSTTQTSGGTGGNGLAGGGALPVEGLVVMVMDAVKLLVPSGVTVAGLIVHEVS